MRQRRRWSHRWLPKPPNEPMQTPLAVLGTSTASGWCGSSALRGAARQPSCEVMQRYARRIPRGLPLLRFTHKDEGLQLVTVCHTLGKVAALVPASLASFVQTRRDGRHVFVHACMAARPLARVCAVRLNVPMRPCVSSTVGSCSSAAAAARPATCGQAAANGARRHQRDDATAVETRICRLFGCADDMRRRFSPISTRVE